MKYLATTFAIAFMAIGFAATSAHAREAYDYSGDGHDCYNSEYGTDCISTSKIDNVEPLTETAKAEGEQAAGCWNWDHEKNRCIPAGQGLKTPESSPTSEFADRDDVSGGDFGESGGGDFEADRAAASTAAE